MPCLEHKECPARSTGNHGGPARMADWAGGPGHVTPMLCVLPSQFVLTDANFLLRRRKKFGKCYFGSMRSTLFKYRLIRSSACDV